MAGRGPALCGNSHTCCSTRPGQNPFLRTCFHICALCAPKELGTMSPGKTGRPSCRGQQLQHNSVEPTHLDLSHCCAVHHIALDAAIGLGPSGGCRAGGRQHSCKCRCLNTCSITNIKPHTGEVEWGDPGGVMNGTAAADAMCCFMWTGLIWRVLGIFMKHGQPVQAP